MIKQQQHNNSYHQVGHANKTSLGAIMHWTCLSSSQLFYPLLNIKVSKDVVVKRRNVQMFSDPPLPPPILM